MNELMRATHALGDVFFFVFIVGVAATLGVVLVLKLAKR